MRADNNAFLLDTVLTAFLRSVHAIVASSLVCQWATIVRSSPSTPRPCFANGTVGHQRLPVLVADIPANADLLEVPANKIDLIYPSPWSNVPAFDVHFTVYASSGARPCNHVIISSVARLVSFFCFFSAACGDVVMFPKYIFEFLTPC